MGKLASFSVAPRERQQQAEQPATPTPTQQQDEAHDAQALTDALKGGDEWTKPLS